MLKHNQWMQWIRDGVLKYIQIHSITKQFLVQYQRDKNKVFKKRTYED